MAEPLLKITNLGKNFGGLIATNDISLTMDRREVIGLIGPNGAGKTTLLRLIMGILKPDSGSSFVTTGKISRVAKLGIL